MEDTYDEDAESQDISEDGESPPPEDKAQPWQASSPSIPQHPSPPPPAPSDNASSGQPAQEVPLTSSDIIVEEPLGPALMPPNHGSCCNSQHTTYDSASTAAEPPINTQVNEELTKSQTAKQDAPVCFSKEVSPTAAKEEEVGKKIVCIDRGRRYISTAAERRLALDRKNEAL